MDLRGLPVNNDPEFTVFFPSLYKRYTEEEQDVIGYFCGEMTRLETVTISIREDQKKNLNKKENLQKIIDKFCKWNIIKKTETKSTYQISSINMFLFISNPKWYKKQAINSKTRFIETKIPILFYGSPEETFKPYQEVLEFIRKTGSFEKLQAFVDENNI